MARNTMSFIKGVGTGIAAGAVIATVSRSMMKNRKSLAKKTGKAMRAVGDFVESMQYMLK
ncbi:MAG TPA: hypothetical protein GXX17_00110 [Clostridiales bacterium]|nr:hypothetical protein [Clostridiales bacterium]